MLIFLLVCYGISNQLIYTDGPFKIWYYLRWVMNKISSELGYLFTCMICLPTWVGVGLSLLNYWVLLPLLITPGNIILDGSYWWLAALIDGAIASGGVWLIHTIQEYFEEPRGNRQTDNKQLLND